MSDGEANLADTWSKITSDPALKDRPDLAATFMKEKVEPFITEMQGAAGTKAGKEYALQTGDRIRQQFWRETQGDQAALTANTVNENAEKVGNNATVAAARDPSQVTYDLQAKQIQQTADTMASMMPEVPGEAGRRAEWHDTYVASHMRNLVIARYQSMAESVASDISKSKTGDPSQSQAYTDAKQTYASDLKAQDWVKGPEWVELGKGLDEAVRRGQELYKSNAETAKSQAVEEGKGVYASLHNLMTTSALSGTPPTPDMVSAIHMYAQKYGASNPGEAASLDDYLVRAQQDAQGNKVQPFNQNVRDSIQAGMALPMGDPRRPTLPSIAKAWSSGSITREDFSQYSEILNKLDKPTEDPTFKPAWEGFVRWQNQMIQTIGQKAYPGTSAARAQFLHDSTAAFMAQGHGGVGWDKALDSTTNEQNPHSFGHVVSFYNKAAMRSDAAEWLQQHDQFHASPTATPAIGGAAAPVYPAKAAPAQPVKLDQKAVDDKIWGGH